MIDATRFRELVEAYNADTHSNTNAYLDLSRFLLSHADALLALVEADEIARKMWDGFSDETVAEFTRPPPPETKP